MEDRLALHRLTPEARETLRRNKPFVLGCLPEAIDRFHDDMSRVASVAKYFVEPTIVAHAREKQLSHWALILDATFGSDYIASVNRIGRTHYTIGLTPRAYIAGYSSLLTAISEIVVRRYRQHMLAVSPDGLDDLLEAIHNALFMDLSYSLEAYMSVDLDEL